MPEEADKSQLPPLLCTRRKGAKCSPILQAKDIQPPLLMLGTMVPKGMERATIPR